MVNIKHTIKEMLLVTILIMGVSHGFWTEAAASTGGWIRPTDEELQRCSLTAQLILADGAKPPTTGTVKRIYQEFYGVLDQEDCKGKGQSQEGCQGVILKAVQDVLIKAGRKNVTPNTTNTEEILINIPDQDYFRYAGLITEVTGGNNEVKAWVEGKTGCPEPLALCKLAMDSLSSSRQSQTTETKPVRPAYHQTHRRTTSSALAEVASPPVRSAHHYTSPEVREGT